VVSARVVAHWFPGAVAQPAQPSLVEHLPAARARWPGHEAKASSSLGLPCGVAHLCCKRVGPVWHLWVAPAVRRAGSVCARVGVLQLAVKMFGRPCGGSISF